ncbi:MAG: DUF5710 domain-containing protein [Oscillospiraceae bacterium]|nr:DUF5710 domain-containing protein [Oscillospiraceae bacterium]
MAILLDVPYAEKDQAKALGALWNPEIKRWYAKNRYSYPKLKRWISQNENFFIICEQLYIIQGERICFKCGKKTRVIGYGVESYFEFGDEVDNGVYHDKGGEIHVTDYIAPFPDKLLNYVQSNYNYKEKYSKFAGCTYLANCCDNCDTLQGDYFLFNEVDSPFWINDESDASKLKLYRIPLEYDLVVDFASITLSSNDFLIKEYGQISDLNL